MKFGVREKPGRYDNLDYDNDAESNPEWTSLRDVFDLLVNRS
ncbi:hypothetical protein [uncultured Thiodictyon sp.]|nr:hypothetical protein [uncultured Thiodictyon sp.]